MAETLDREGGPYVVFVSAHDHHAMRAFDVGAVDYLLKPFTPERFDRMLERARERIQRGAVRRSWHRGQSISAVSS